MGIAHAAALHIYTCPFTAWARTSEQNTAAVSRLQSERNDTPEAGAGVTAALLRRVAVVPALHTAATDNEGKRVNIDLLAPCNRQAVPDAGMRGVGYS